VFSGRKPQPRRRRHGRATKYSQALISGRRLSPSIYIVLRVSDFAFPAQPACRRSISADRQAAHRHSPASPSTGITCGKATHQQHAAALPQAYAQTSEAPHLGHGDAGEGFDGLSVKVNVLQVLLENHRPTVRRPRKYRHYGSTWYDSGQTPSNRVKSQGKSSTRSSIG
jgi:hypothetical protein